LQDALVLSWIKISYSHFAHPLGS